MGKIILRPQAFLHEVKKTQQAIPAEGSRLVYSERKRNDRRLDRTRGPPVIAPLRRAALPERSFRGIVLSQSESKIL